MDMDNRSLLVAAAMSAVMFGCGGDNGEKASSVKSAKDASVARNDAKDDAKDGTSAGGRDDGASDNKRSTAGKGESAAGKSGSGDKPASMGKEDSSQGAAGEAGSSEMAAAKGGSGESAGTSGGGAEPPSGDGCSDGLKMIGGKCACDLGGTFALRQRFAVTLTSTGTEELNDATVYWSIVHAEAGADGKVSLSLTACGQSTPDICGTGAPPLIPGAEAYAQYVPASVWDKADVRSSTVELALAGALPDSDFVTPPIAQLAGIALADPLGAWPSARKDVEGGDDFDGSAVNGAKWVDLDGDKALGLTNFAVPPGGVSASQLMPGATETFDATSKACPRSDASAPRSPYAYLPTVEGVQLRRMKRYQTSQRIVSELHGKLETCDRASGSITGQKGSAVKLESIFGGCVLVDGSSETPCSSTLLNNLESMGGGLTLKVASGEFVMMRVADDFKCGDVRTTKFD
jgi:hypothetical protein